MIVVGRQAGLSCYIAGGWLVGFFTIFFLFHDLSCNFSVSIFFSRLELAAYVKKSNKAALKKRREVMVGGELDGTFS